MNFNKTFLTLGLAATLLQMPTSSFAQNAGGNRQNPLLVKSSLPFGAPDFSKIQESDYLPAFEAGIKEQRANIQKIISNKKKPTFQNTILAYENSGRLLDRVSNVFFGLTSAHKTPGIAEAQKKVEAAYKDEKKWAKMALLNTACSGKFSSDRTIQQYVDEIWHLEKVHRH